jgi:hypothetical protein
VKADKWRDNLKETLMLIINVFAYNGSIPKVVSSSIVRFLRN